MNVERGAPSSIEQYKGKLENVERTFRRCTPEGKSIVFEFTSQRHKTGVPARVVRSWENSNEAIISFYLPDHAEELERQKSFGEFLGAHEISHLFTPLFTEEFTTKLSERDVREANEAVLSNPLISTGQTELLADLIALRMAGDSDERMGELAQQYAAMIGACWDLITERDAVRFRHGIQYLVDGGFLDEERSREALYNVDSYISAHIDLTREHDKKYYDIYDAALVKIKIKFAASFPDAESLREYIGKANAKHKVSQRKEAT